MPAEQVEPTDDAGPGGTHEPAGRAGPTGSGGPAGGAEPAEPAAPSARPVRLDAQAVRLALRVAGLRARHSMSQNFLADVDILEAILAEAAPSPGGRVLEIGPGLGILTGGLLAAGASVVAIELDAGLEARLRREFAAEIELGRTSPGAPRALQLVRGDALDVDLGPLVAPPYDLVANLPYHITSPTLHRFLGGEAPRPRRMVLMLQREVAERIAAAPGAMSYLSVFVQYHAAVRVAFVVPPGAFEPEPAVDSAVVVVEPRARPDEAAGADGGAGTVRPPLDPEGEDALWRLVQAAFRERRKMIHNVLARQLPIGGATVASGLATAGIAPGRRPQTLSVAEWIALLEALGPLPEDRRGRRAGAGSAG